MCEDTVFTFCRRVFSRGDNVLTAVSGGADSTVLLHILAALRERLGIASLGVAHVNHGLRGAESDREEAFVRTLAAGYGCPFHLKRLAGLALDSPGIEERARKQRYAFFTSCMRAHSYRFAATGHTADDQAETVLMRILRGAGMTGLAGIRPVRDDGVIRPLLTLRHARFVDWLKGRGLTYCNDSSNEDRRFTRNWIRNEIIPALLQREPRAVEHLCGCAEYARRYLKELAPKMNKWIARYVISDAADRFILRKWNAGGSVTVAQESLAALLRRHEIPFDRRHIERLLHEGRRSGGEFLLPAGWRFLPKRTTVEIVSAKFIPATRATYCHTLEIPGTSMCAQARCSFIAAIGNRRNISLAYNRKNTTVYLDALMAGKALVYRSIGAGDIFQPLGADRPRNARHFLKAQKVENRWAVGAVAKASGEILWIPSVAVGHKFRVTEKTKTILKIAFEPVI